jgi:ABC-2 type transport system permease protein
MTAVLRAFVRRDWLVARAYKLPFALAALQILLGLVLIFYLARIVDDAKLVEDVKGLDAGYFGFVVVGFSTLTLVEVALMTFSRRIRADQTSGVLEAILAAPVPNGMVLLGGAAYELLYGAALALLQIALAIVAFGFAPSAGPLDVAAIAITYPALVAVFGAGGVLVAAFAVVYKDPSAVVGLASAALAVLTGVWFPVDVLPGFLQAVAGLIPLTWGNDVLRAAFAGDDVPWGHVAALAALALAAVPVAVRVFGAAVNTARRAGSLGQY